MLITVFNVAKNLTGNSSSIEWHFKEGRESVTNAPLTIINFKSTTQKNIHYFFHSHAGGELNKKEIFRGRSFSKLALIPHMIYIKNSSVEGTRGLRKWFFIHEIWWGASQQKEISTMIKKDQVKKKRPQGYKDMSRALLFVVYASLWGRWEECKKENNEKSKEG